MKTVWRVDGVDLNPADGAWSVGAGTMPATPGSQRSAELVLPGRSGMLSRRLGWGEAVQRITLNLVGGHAESVPARAARLRGLLGRARTLELVEPGRVPVVADVVRVVLSEPQRESPLLWRVEAVFSLQPFWVEGAAVLPSGDRFYRVTSGVPTAPVGALFEVSLSGGRVFFDDRAAVGLG